MTNTEETEVKQFYEELQDLLDLTPKKDIFFITGDWNAEVGSQGIPGITGKFGLGSKAKTNRMLPREHIGHSKCPLPTISEMILHMDITRWSIQKLD